MSDLPEQRDDKPENRRIFQRREVRAEVTMTSDDNFYHGFSNDISEGGVFVTTHDLRPLGSIVEVVFSLPDGIKERITVKGEVRWVRDYDTEQSHIDPGMGLRFIDLKDEDRERIEAFVERREPLFYDDED